MSAIAMDVARMIDMLPNEEQFLAHELIKRLVLAWDPDYTKVTPAEAKELDKAESAEYINSDDIDWDNLSKYAQ